jgi:hypothetical protein
MIDYWAQMGQSFGTAMSIHDGQRQIECWFPTTLEPVTTEPTEVYLDWLNLHWQAMLTEYGPLVAQPVVGQHQVPEERMEGPATRS